MAEGDAERYRKYAQECLFLSAQAQALSDKEHWLKIAEEWLKMAASVEQQGRLLIG